MKNKSIKYIAEKLGGKLVGNEKNFSKKIKDFSTDTRTITKGCCFVALKGENYDGHEFINVATEKMALLCVVSYDWYKKNYRKKFDVVLLVVPDTLFAYGEIARVYRLNFQIPIIAVAGSNGKTTTKEMLADVLAQEHKTLRTEGNLNNLIGVPTMILRLQSEHEFAVIEIGTNTPGEIRRLSEILNPTVGVITNIGREHLELLKNLDGVAKEEGELFKYLCGSGGTLIVNNSDEYIRKIIQKLPQEHLQKLSYADKLGSDIVYKIISLNEFGAPLVQLKYQEKSGQKEVKMELKASGLHTASNAAAVFTICLALGLQGKKVAKALEKFRPIEYKSGYARLAIVQGNKGFRVLNDTYNSNPDSVIAALKTLCAMKIKKDGERIAVLADMKELGEKSKVEHENIAIEISKLAVDRVLFYGNEMKYAFKKFKNIIKKEGNNKFEINHFSVKTDLIKELKETLNKHDIILVKGSRGMKMEEVVREIC